MSNESPIQPSEQQFEDTLAASKEKLDERMFEDAVYRLFSDGAVSVPRSSGVVDLHWRLDAIYGGKVYVRSEDGDLAKSYTLDEFLKHNMLKLEQYFSIRLRPGDPVQVFRSSGELESGWRVINVGNGVVSVVNGTGEGDATALVKHVRLEDFFKANCREFP